MKNHRGFSGPMPKYVILRFGLEELYISELRSECSHLDVINVISKGRKWLKGDFFSLRFFLVSRKNLPVVHLDGEDMGPQGSNGDLGRSHRGWISFLGILGSLGASGGAV